VADRGRPRRDESDIGKSVCEVGSQGVGRTSTGKPVAPSGCEPHGHVACAVPDFQDAIDEKAASVT
jgi:hypothetical protein